ncbi:hypothetical protein EDB19DRAFT_1914263 [Suillus lakei]|nr:hypothetical protein EDB19DRAFT_1914263 [Suillus lakei]
MSIFLKETLSTKHRLNFTSTMVITSSSPNRESHAQKPMANTSLRSLLTPAIVIPIANFAMLALLDVSLMVLWPLFFSTPTYLGGLGFDPASIGSWMVLFGIIDAVFQGWSKVGDVDDAVTFTLPCQLVMAVAWHMAYGTIALFITASVATYNVLGQTSVSVVRAVGPALATLLFAASK